MVFAYNDDIVIAMVAIETFEDHMVRLREVFECLLEAGFKMRSAKCDFMKSEIKNLGCVVSAEVIKPDHKAVSKLRDWEVPRNCKKYPGRQNCKCFWALPIIFASLFLLMPNLCMQLPAWVRLSPGGMTSNRPSTPVSWLHQGNCLSATGLGERIGPGH